MSSGGSPGDIIIVLELAKNLYRKCKVAGGEYIEIAGEVGSLHTVLRHLKYEVEDPSSLLNVDNSNYGSQIKTIIGNCDYTLGQLDAILRKYERFANDRPGVWNRIRFASSEMDSLNDVRMKLNNHKTTITVFLETVQLHHGAHVSRTLEVHGGQLDVILDKVDKIAGRMGQRAGSMLTTYGSDDKEVWKEFRRELIAEGFQSDVLMRNKDILRAYIREIDQKGLLTELPLTSVSASQSVSPEWLESVTPGAQAAENENQPPNETMKEVVVHEENMKFPQSIKNERGQLDLQTPLRDVQHGMSALSINTKQDHNYLVSPPTSDLGHENSSNDESRTSSKPAIMRTSDNVNSRNFDNTFLRAPQPRLPQQVQSGSRPDYHYRSNTPASIKSQASNGSKSRSMTWNERTMAESPEFRDHLCNSPGEGSQPLPIPSRHKRGNHQHSRSPRPRSSPLAPDSMGNEIPLDAKWTKIKRSLVCLEVLDQGGYRYEARPDFVAILGVLTHSEIEEIAIRSDARREARRNHSREPPNQALPRNVPQNFRYNRERKSGYNTWSDDSSDSSSKPERRERSGRKERRKRDYNITANNKQYPNASPSPNWSPTQPPRQAIWPSSAPPPGWQSPVQIQDYPHSYSSSNKSQGMPTFPQPNSQPPFGHYPPPQPYISAPPFDNRSHRNRRHSDSDRHQSKDRDGRRDTGRNNRWRENLAAVGIGGAAVSLLSVLGEAAGEF